jgi:hypothetical protein
MAKQQQRTTTLPFGVYRIGIGIHIPSPGWFGVEV